MSQQLEALKQSIANDNLDDFITSQILDASTPHAASEKLDVLAKKVASRFNISRDDLSMYVVGSSKLGYALHPKKVKNPPEGEGEEGTKILPAFRPFGPNSDIDIALVSPRLFEKIWNNISAHAISVTPRMPWNSDKLGDYMVHGWLRPDMFPRTRARNDWWKTFDEINYSRLFGPQKVSGALYYSREYLHRYQLRGLLECRRNLQSGV